MIDYSKVVFKDVKLPSLEYERASKVYCQMCDVGVDVTRGMFGVVTCNVCGGQLDDSVAKHATVSNPIYLIKELYE